ncbi:MAG: prepilin-type N-terminal cleavage/methylation domain-containing protein, partial [Candidatus Electrothrix sp. AS4_5]|nr:prepilin-type N-terminal cleavage/methylation domain-containing protein [Candidatus Electrothrix gigas]
MKKIKKIHTENGFTLIETLMAMAIFTIGILGLFGMQT